MNLESFDQGKKKKKKAIIISISCVLVTVILLSGSFALYKKNDTATLTDGEVRYPRADEIPYETEYNEDVETVQDAIEDLYDKLGG